jgi:hypothetical protein
LDHFTKINTYFDYKRFVLEEPYDENALKSVLVD